MQHDVFGFHQFLTRRFGLLAAFAAAFFSTLAGIAPTASELSDSVVVFNEIMYNPAPTSRGDWLAEGIRDDQEWIELHNQLCVDVAIGGWKLEGGIDLTFPEGSVIRGGGFAIVTAGPSDARLETSYVPVFGPFSGRLANGGERLVLRNHTGRLMDEVEYGDGDEWPVGPDGSGFTLAKREPGTPSAPPANWTVGAQPGGTPGTHNFPPAELGPGWRALLPTGQTLSVFIPGNDALGTGWRETDFDDSDWLLGASGVGYETKPEWTSNYLHLIGLDVEDVMFDVNRTCYIRIPFLVRDPSAFTSLTLRAKYHGGFAAYLNGVEIARSNAVGELTWNSGASVSHAGKKAVAFENFDVLAHVDLLRAGRNVLAVQALSDEIDSPDFIHLPELHGYGSPSPGRLAINEIPPATTSEFWVEITNSGSALVDTSGFVLKREGVGASETRLPAQVVEPGGFLLLDAESLGFHPEAGDRLFLVEPDGLTLSDARRVDARLRGCYPEGSDSWLYPDAPTAGAPNRLTLHDEIVINEIMYHHRPQYKSRGNPAVYDRAPLLPIDAAWRYQQSGAPLDPQWKQPDFNDASWPRGAAVLAKALLPVLPEPIGTPLKTEGQTTYYFRTEFDFAGDPRTGELELSSIVDDGAVFYLNGVEVLRLRMPDGAIAPTTTATESVRNAEYDGPFAVSSDALVAGRNVLAAEVHQVSASSNDVAFAAKLAWRELLRAAAPATSFTESSEEWIEIYNRSTGSVDLSGWRFSGAVDFVFDPGTLLGPDEYLLAARDAAALAEKYDGIRIAGSYDRSLSRRGERLLLFDAAGNPADSVFYRDDRPWPAFADGGGSSLELRDPRADNLAPEAWAASDETTRSTWRRYSYQGVVEPPVYNPVTNFQELVLGLLDSGEVLLDNVSVVENPEREHIELIQNGTFESDYSGQGPEKWRITGTHGASHVVVDPDRPDNKCLRLAAEARILDLSDHAETTLNDGVFVQDGYEYRISFDAKWLKGSPQLRTELRYNDLARTTILDQPVLSGTPGRRNSTYRPNIGPTYRNLEHAPAVPKPGEPIHVGVEATDSNDVASVLLRYALDGPNEPAWTALEMSLDPSGRYAGVIPAQKDGTIVRFYVEGRDTLGAVSYSPAAGPDSRALCKVMNGFAPSELRHDMILLMTQADTDFMFTPVNLQSNALLGATLVYDGREVFHDIGVRLKGSPWSRGQAHTGYHLQFSTAKPFRGIHDSITVRNNTTVEIQVKHLILQAGLPGMYDDLASLDTPSNLGEGVAAIGMARYGDVFLSSQFPNGEDGTVIKMAGIHIPMINTGLENPKTYMPIDYVWDFDLRALGDTEQYRWPYRISNNRAKDDWDWLASMCEAFGSPSEKQRASVEAVIDIDEWMRKYALLSLCGIGDTYSFSEMHPHNVCFYRPPDGGKILALPWDWDFAFAREIEAPLIGIKNLALLQQKPGVRRLFYGHILDLSETLYTTEYMEPWLKRYGDVAGQSFLGNLDYIAQRRAYARSQLKAPVPFEITTNGGADFAASGTSVTLEGRGWINVREIRLAEDGEPLNVYWIDDERWQASIALEPGANTLNLLAYDFQGRPTTSTSIVVTAPTGERPPLADLRVSEVMYNPAGGSEYEFIEICNIGSSTLDLAPLIVSEAIETFAFSGASISELSPGGCALLVSDRAAFESRYGKGLPVAGQYSGQLANGGETIRLSTAAGVLIEFAYDDARGWPLPADGAGHSLVPLPEALPDEPAGALGYGGNWRPSAQIGGSPGASDPAPEMPLVLLNELAANTADSASGGVSNDWIELRSWVATTVSLAGWYLSDDVAEPLKWAIPTDASISAGSLIRFDEANDFHAPEGFALSSAGEEILLTYLPEHGPGRVVDWARFEGQEPGATLGRLRKPRTPGSPDVRHNSGLPFWYAMSPTPGAANASPSRDLVVSEILYQATGESTYEYVEICNPTLEAIALGSAQGSWRLAGAADMVFTSGTIIAPGACLLVVNFDPAHAESLAAFREAFGPESAQAALAGPWSGGLPDGGGRVALERPLPPSEGDTEPAWVLVDEAIYFHRAPFPAQAAGMGKSLHRVAAERAGLDPANWTAASPTPGWTDFGPAQPNLQAIWVLY